MMRVLFIVQGEGRGHLTQAISLAQILQSAGHHVVGAWVNVAQGRPIPDFFTQEFTAPITAVAGPLLVYNPCTSALRLGATLRGMVGHLAQYRRSLRQLRDAIETQAPDVVVNFFELLGGMTYGCYSPVAPMVCVGHQCLGLHPDFPYPAGRQIDRWGFKALVRLTSWGATLRLGLSFDEQPDVPRQRLCVVPPLLRKALLASLSNQPRPDPSAYVLAYTTQPSLLSMVLAAHQQQPLVPIRYFYADVTQPDMPVDDTLSLHAIDGKRYLDAMQHCRAVLTTAGFESVCEAMYLGKPVLMMPQPGHYEQACNALDGERAGAGLADTHFDLTRLLAYLPQYDPAVGKRFRAWQAQAPARFVALLEVVASARLANVPANS